MRLKHLYGVVANARQVNSRGKDKVARQYEPRVDKYYKFCLSCPYIECKAKEGKLCDYLIAIKDSKCVCCGAEVPEGRQVCYKCEKGAENDTINN